MTTAAEERLGLTARVRSAARMPLSAKADDATWKTLVAFCSYRVGLALLVAVIYAFFNAFFLIGVQAPATAVATIVAYVILSVLLMAPAWIREPNLAIQVSAGVLVDVVFIVLLMHTSGGIRSGLGTVLLVSLAAAGLITRGRLAFFHAAVASLAVLFEQAFQLWRFDAPPNDFVQAGLMSVAFFATAAAGFTLARYASTSERIAQERTVDLANLSQINELVIHDMQDGILVVDSEGRIRQHNPRVETLLGPLPPGRRPSLAEYAPEVAAMLEASRSGPETTFMQFRSPRSSSELAVQFVAIGTGNPPPSVIFIEDVGRMRAQAQQMKLVALGRLTASIAHEIRNPLSSISHAAELLGEDAGAADGDKRLLSIIRDNVFRLDRMVQEVLYLNRRDRAQPEAIDARAWLANFAKEFCEAEKVAQDVIDYQVRTTQRIYFDRQHLDQVMWNLTRNALRHGRRMTGSIRIVLAPGNAPGTLLLDVSDDGQGVARENQAHLFEPFFTTDSQGTGLGLYIARELCEGNGARIEYLDELAGGQFRITMKGA